MEDTAIAKPAKYCVVFHFHQPPYDDSTIHRYDECCEQSYKIHLDALDSVPNVKVNFNITGILLETMEKRNPEFISRLGKKVDSGRVYLTACGYTHPIFPIIFARLGEEACKMQVERDREIKKRLFGVEPRVFRLPEYAVDDPVLKLLHEYGFEGTIVPDSVFPGKGVGMAHVLDCGLKTVCRNDYLSNVLAGNDFDGNNNFRWLAMLGGTPEKVAGDFARRILLARRVLTDCDAESYNHWLITSGVPSDKQNVLKAIYESLLSNDIETTHLPEFIDSAVPEKAGEIPRVSYDGDLSAWEGWPEHAGMWSDIKRCWDMYLQSRDERVLDLAMRAQTSCWEWAVSKKYPDADEYYPEWWKMQPSRYRQEIEASGF